MSKKNEIELTVGSEYRILSLGGKDHVLKSEGIFRGYVTVGMEEIGLLIKLNEKHEDMNGKIRIVPLHVILAIDVLDAKPDDENDDEKEMPNYVG
jgi:hypothetical protein